MTTKQFHFVTAATGRKHRRFAIGLIRSFAERMPDASLTVYTDRASCISGPAEIIPLKRSTCRRWQRVHPAPHTWLKLHAMTDQFERGADNVCWIDCDQLVGTDLRDHLTPGIPNVVPFYATGWQKPRDRRRFLGNGLTLMNWQYAIGGLFSLPSIDDVSELIRILHEQPTWEQQPLVFETRDLHDQLLLNHFIASCIYDKARPVRWIRDDKALFTFEVWRNHLHPHVLKPLRYEDSQLSFRDRPVGIVLFTAVLLKQHLRDGFACVEDEVARHKLIEYYRQ